MRHFGSIVPAGAMLVFMTGLILAAPGAPLTPGCEEIPRVATRSCHATLVGEGEVDRKEAPMQAEHQRTWRAAPVPSAASTASDQEGLALIRQVAHAPECRLIQNDAGSLALVAAYRDLRRALTSLGGELAAEQVRPDELDLVVLLAVLDEMTSGETLVRWLEETGTALDLVWVAVPRERPAGDPAESWLQARGTTAVGRLELTSGAGAAKLVADLYPLDPEVTRRSVGEKLRAAEPVAEGPDNLEGRAEWFRRRAGPTR
jgi:hypothetical protein